MISSAMDVITINVEVEPKDTLQQIAAAALCNLP
jgi:hypothetical protein